jgi:hypothetical protein
MIAMCWIDGQGNIHLLKPNGDTEIINKLVEALEECLPYAQACIGLPRSAWPPDSCILKAEFAIAMAKADHD